MKKSDPTIERIRRVRHEISARFGHDPDALVAHYMELDKQYEDQLARDLDTENPKLRQEQEDEAA